MHLRPTLIRGLSVLLALQVAVQAQTGDPPSRVESARTLLAESRELQASGDPTGARDLVREAVGELLAAPGLDEHDEGLRLLETLSDLAFDSNAFQEARAGRERLVEVYERERPPDHEDLQRTREALAVSLARLGEEPRAIELVREVIASRERTLPPDHVDLAGARLNLAAFTAGGGDPEAALAIYEEVYAILEGSRPDDDPTLQTARQHLASTLSDLGDQERATALQERVLEVHEARYPEDHVEVLRARMNLALMWSETGDLDRARELLESAFAGLSRTLPEDHEDLQLARQNLAAVLLDAGDYARALELQEQDLAIRARRHPADHPDMLLARFNLAASMFSTGDYAGARLHWEVCLEAFERTLAEGHPHLELARQNLASALLMLGDLVGARSLHEKVLAGMEARLPPDHLEVQKARVNLAGVLYSMDDLEGARRLYDQALATFLRTLTWDHPDVQRAGQGLASALRELGDVDGAMELEETALEAMERRLPPEHPSLQMVRVNLAMSRSLSGDLEGARELEEDVLALRTRTLPPDHPRLTSVRRNLAWTLAGLDDREALAPLLLDLAVGLRRTAERAVATSSRERQEVAHTLLGRCATVLSLAALYPDDARLAAETFAVVEQIRDLSSGRPVWQRAAADPEARELLARVMEARRRLASHLARDAAPPGAPTLDDLIRERDGLERELAQRLAERAGEGPHMDVRALSRALPEGACAVGIWRYGHLSVLPDEPWKTEDEWRLAAHVVHGDGRLDRLDLGPLEPIAAAVERWRAAVGTPLGARGVTVSGEPLPADEGRAAAELERLVVEPLLAAVGDARTLYVCLDDALHLVPLDALPLGEGLLGERLEVHVEVTFGRLLAPLPDPTAEPVLLALGGVDFDARPDGPERPPLAAEVSSPPEGLLRAGASGSWAELPGTRGEVLSIAERFRSIHAREPTTLLGSAASKTALVTLAPRARFLHVATHGWFVPEDLPERGSESTDALWSAMSLADTIEAMAPMTLCGLALAGANRAPDEGGRAPGVLTAEELAGLDLSACELAVLSACETHVGLRRAGQSIQSLQAALHAAGARSAITSLWKVDDLATRDLFERFYTSIWVEGASKSQALWAAKSSLRAEGRPTRDWAGWVLTGRPR